MRYRMMRLLSLFFLCGVVQLTAARGVATHTAELTVTWSAITQPDDFSGFRYFFGLIGGVHNGFAEFSSPGEGLVSRRVRDMAEPSAKGARMSEGNTAIHDGVAEEVLSTLVSVLAPSPDWVEEPTLITLGVSLPTVAEGEGTASVVTVTATVAGGEAFAQAQTVTVSVGKQGDSAVEGADYASISNFVITIPAGAASATGTFVLEPTDDGIVEGSETVSVEGTLGGKTVMPTAITITDNSVAGTDTDLSLAFVFPDGYFPYNCENEYDYNYDYGQDGEYGYGDCDYGYTNPEIFLSGADMFLSEVDHRLGIQPPASKRFPLRFRVTSESAVMSDSPVPVRITVTDRTADSSDYRVVEIDELVMIPAGGTSAEGSMVIAVLGDTFIEGTERINVTASSPGLPRATQSIFILDRSIPSTALLLVIAPVSLDEDAASDGIGSVQVAALLNAASRDTETSVTISVADGTAGSADYRVVSSEINLVIQPGELNGVGTVEIEIIDDGEIEEDETIVIEASAEGLDIARREFTITDDDTPSSATVGLSLSEVAEDVETASFTIENIGAPRNPPPGSWDYDWVPRTAGPIPDYALANESDKGNGAFLNRLALGLTSNATFPDMILVSFFLNVDGGARDGINLTEGFEQSESFIRIYTNNGTTSDLILPGPTALSNRNPDPTEFYRYQVSVDVANRIDDWLMEYNSDPLNANDLHVEFLSTAEEVTVTVTLDDGKTFVDERTMMVSIGAQGDSAEEGTDYVAVNDFEIMIPAGASSVTGTFTLDPINDDIAEDSETVSVVGALSGVTMAPGRITITDNDALLSATVGVSLSEVAEDVEIAPEVTVTVTVDNGRTFVGEQTVTVSVGAQGDSAEEGTDYVAVDDFEIMIPAGAPSAMGTFTLDPINDDIAEDSETVSVVGLLSGRTVTPARVTITDNDAQSIALALTIAAPAQLHEGSGTSWVRFSTGLGGAARTTDTPVDISVTGGTATAGADYSVLTVPTSLIILAGEISISDSLQITVIDDDMMEGDETIIIEVSSMGFTSAMQNLVIIDDEIAVTGVEGAEEVPEGYVLEQNYPNPFNPVTAIRYDLAAVGHVRLEVSDLLGRRVAVLVDGVQQAGAQEVRFDAGDLPSGMYLYRLRVEDFVSVKKMVLSK